MAVERSGIAKDVTEVSFVFLDAHFPNTIFSSALPLTYCCLILVCVVDWKNPVSVSK